MPFNSSSKRKNQSFLAWCGLVWVQCCPVWSCAVNSHTGQSRNEVTRHVKLSYRIVSYFGRNLPKSICSDGWWSASII